MWCRPASKPPSPASTRWSSTRRRLPQLEEKQAGSPAHKAKASAARHTRWLIAREKVLISRIVRELKYTAMERKRLLDKVNKTVDTMRTLERQIRSLDQKFEASQKRGTEEGVPPPAEKLQGRSRKDRSRRRRNRSRNSSARSAR